VARVLIEWLYIDYEGGIMPLSIILQPEFRLFLGDINRKNSENMPKYFLVIYDDDFEKKHHCYQIMPNGS
jgi:hypothetical protein